MKNLILFSSFLTQSFCFGQFSLDVGLRKQVENFKTGNRLAMIATSPQQRYLNDCFLVKTNYDYSNWVFSFEASFMPKFLYLSGSNSTTETNSSSSTTSSYEYSSHIKLGYLGLRTGIDRKFFTEKKVNLLLGLSINSDVLLYKKENNQYFANTSTTWFSTGMGGNYYTSNSASETEFEMINAELFYLNFGLNIAVRYNFTKTYIDIFLNNAISTYTRYSQRSNSFGYFESIPGRNDHTLIGSNFYTLEYGIRLGFNLNGNK